jgi:hypothetical protein
MPTSIRLIRQPGIGSGYCLGSVISRNRSEYLPRMKRRGRRAKIAA